MYNDVVREHFNNPRNTGPLPDANGEGQTGDANSGDIVRIFIKVIADHIADIRFQAMGCGAAIACSSMLTEMAKGRLLKEAFTITDTDVAQALGGLPDTKLRCSNLAAQALHLAIEDYRSHYIENHRQGTSK